MYLVIQTTSPSNKNIENLLSKLNDSAEERNKLLKILISHGEQITDVKFDEEDIKETD